MEINTTIISGRLTRDPELKYTPSGSPVCAMSIAHNEWRKDQEPRASFFDCSVWGKQAESCNQHLAKGAHVLVEGRIRQDRWEAQDGTKRSRVNIIAHRVMFLDPVKGQGQGQGDGGDRPEDRAVDQRDDEEPAF